MKPTDETLARFDEASQVVENLAKHLTKDTLIDIARVLAIYIAQYRRLYGDIDDQTPLKPHTSRSPDDEKNELLIMASEGLDYLADTMLYELEKQKNFQKQGTELH